MNGIKIRKLLENDFNGFNVLMNQVHKLHVLNRPDIYKDIDDSFFKEYFSNVINDENMISIIAKLENKVIGLCIITIKSISKNPLLIDRKVASMEVLCIHEDYRKQGIGDILFKEGKKLSLEFDVQSLELMVWEFNDDALRFYKNKGMNIRNEIMEMRL